jgi:hypothetical protein
MKYYLYMLILLSYYFYSCYEAVEGCTDPLASNYRLNADESCTSCCTYPEVFIKLQHKWGTSVFQNNKEYTSSKGQNFTVINHKFYIGNIRIFDEMGLEISNRKTLLFTSAGTRKIINQNFCLINGTLSDCKSGSFKHQGVISKITFNNILPEELNSLDSVSVARDPALSRSEGMYINGVYQGFFCSISIPGRVIPLTLFISPIENISLSLTNFKHEKFGKPIEISIGIDYEKLFNDVDFASETALKQGLEKNLKNSFFIP